MFRAIQTCFVLSQSARLQVQALIVGTIVLGSLIFSKNVLSEEISFNRDIRSILSDKCFHCHGPDAENQDSAFRLDTQEHAFEDLGGYAGIVPGDLEASELHLRIRSDEEGMQMPPKEAVRQLTEAERDLLDKWILAGAPFEKHWSFEPVAEKIAVPDAGGDWAKNEIDRFIFDRYSKKELQPNKPATSERWLRRVTFDLTGLPPTLEELDAFVGNDNAQTRDQVVDRLLKSDACAERLATEWMDVARYSDSFGYQRDDERLVWPWRDWVIDAFRENMPFDQFVTWQLAGDLLPNATREQILATAFCRLHSHNKEGGVALEEFRVEYVSDRAHTFSAALMGLTLECARCHDHKYDPIKTKEYYEISSFFANLDERGLISYFTDATPTPAMPIPSPEQETRLEQAAAEIQAAEEKLDLAIQKASDDFEAWLSEQRHSVDEPGQPEIGGLTASVSFEEFLPVVKEESLDEEGKERDPETMHGLGNDVPATKMAVTTHRNSLTEGKLGKAIKLTGDDAIWLPGISHYDRDQPFTVSLWINNPTNEERAVIFRRSRGWDDAGSIGYELTRINGYLHARVVHFWPGNAIAVKSRVKLKTDVWQHIALTYDGSSTAGGLQIYVDGQPVRQKIVKDHLTRTIDEWREGYYDFAIGARYRDRGFTDGLVDELRFYNREISSLEIAHLHDGESLAAALDHTHDPDYLLTDQERTQLKSWYLTSKNSDVAVARQQLQEARVTYNRLMDETPAISIMRELPKPFQSYLLKRGVYDDRGEKVFPDTPEFLPPYPEDAPRNRLGLAQWLMMPNHPLTSRVVVNRYWQMFFGEGLVRTPEDFGVQGQPPTHPELMDWLARDLMENGWNIRRLIKQIVLSETYAQSSVVDPETRNKDPENIFLARGPGHRLSAEMVRDNVLKLSGLLVDKLGGPPVKPYDLELAYTPLDADTGEGLYRRSLYTFWKRMSPAPVMMTLDASRREVCRLQREITASPLQALVLLNGTQFVEASRSLAARLVKEHGDDHKALVEHTFRLLTSRFPSEEEQSVLEQLYTEQLQHFGEHADLALELLGKSASKFSESERAANAATTVVVNTVMNLDESVRLK